MIAAIIHWSLAHRPLVLIATALLLVSGLAALRSTPVDAIPDLSDVQVIVQTSFPGQAPRLVEDQVTYPVSTAMLGVPAARAVRGYSFFGDSYVYVLFDDGTDPYWARSRVLESLAQLQGQLPDGARPRLGPDASGVGWIYEYALVDRSGNTDLAQLTSLQNWFLKFELQALPGVAEVATVGGMVREYQVVPDPLALRQHGLPLQTLTQAIRDANLESGGGVIEMAEAEYMVRASGYLGSVEDLAAIRLRTRADGTPLLLGDVAEIRTGPQLRRGIAELNGEGEVVGGIIVMRSGENARSTIEGVRAALERLQTGLPPGVEIVTVYDRAPLIDRSIATLRSTLVKELLIVAIVCAVFLLHMRSALVTLISLPLGILGAFLLMRLHGLNANIMSLGGIAIAIGAMVDAAIVMVENLHKHLAQEDERTHWERVRDASIEVGPPVFFSLLIITLSFLPVLALQAQEGRLFAPLAWTKTYAMAMSAGLAITLVPVLMGYLIRGPIRSAESNPLQRALLAVYRPVLRLALQHPLPVLVLALALVLSSLWPARQLDSAFMPPLDEEDWMYMPTTDPGISIGEARQLLQLTDALIKSVPEVASVFGKIGRAQTATDPAPLTMIETTIRFTPRESWPAGRTLEDIRADIRARVKIPGLSDAWVMPIRTRIDMLATGVRTPVGIRISGPELGEIQRIGLQLETLLQAAPGTSSAYAERSSGGRYLKLDMQREALARHGLSMADAHLLVRSAIGAGVVTQTVEGRERYPVSVRYPQSWRDSPGALENLPIIAPDGRQLALGDIAHIRFEDGAPMIKSENARPVGWVFLDTDSRDLAGYVETMQRLVDAEISLPAGYTLAWSGQYESLQRANQRLLQVLPLILLLVLALLWAAFQRLAETLLILGTLPFALVGGFWVLYLLQFEMSVAVAVGFIALVGVATEIGVLMLVYLNQSTEALLRGTGSAPPSSIQLREAIFEGALARLRPVTMTSITLILGLLPVMLGQGTGAEVMQRIAAPLFGGSLSALLLTLIVLPAAYLLLWQGRIRLRLSAPR